MKDLNKEPYVDKFSSKKPKGGQKEINWTSENTKLTFGWEKANLFIFEKCFDEPPSTTYDARVKGAPTKPNTAALLSTWRSKNVLWAFQKINTRDEKNIFKLHKRSMYRIHFILVIRCTILFLERTMTR